MGKYQIGDFNIIWKEGNFPLYQDEYMEQFWVKEHEERLEDIVYESHFLDLEKFEQEKLLQKNGLYELYETQEGKVIIYHWATCRFAFGFKLKDLEKGNIVPCYFHIDMLNERPIDAVRFFSCSGLHSKLLQKGALVFHASYVDWNGKGILFAGKSGMGKSTQASLWKIYANAEIVNGDRALIRKYEDVWKVYGYPCCGSSKVCINRTLPLTVIVLLEQGEKNELQTISTVQKLQAILAGSEMYLWNEKEIQRVSEIAEKIIDEVPIIKLVCRPDAEAVEVLKRKLEEMLNE